MIGIGIVLVSFLSSVILFDRIRFYDILIPLSAGFFLLCALKGLTDVLDGWVARKTKTAGDFGARLDSAADLHFF